MTPLLSVGPDERKPRGPALRRDRQRKGSVPNGASPPLRLLLSELVLTSLSPSEHKKDVKKKAQSKGTVPAQRRCSSVTECWSEALTFSDRNRNCQHV